MTKILVIEDETPLREEILATLTLEGYEVIGAVDGVEGINFAVLDPPDLIICDISMPRFDGYGVLLDVRSNPALQSIPFIFMSAKTTLGDIRKGMQSGADDYVTKPFNRVDLLQAIQTRLKKKTEHDIENQQQIDAFKEALEIERNERLLQAKLVAMFSHDFRNQLTIIVSSASMVRDYADRITEQRRSARLDAIEGAGRLLVGMLDDMLNLAQMETGNFVLKPEPLNIAQFFYDMVQEFKMIAGGTHRLQFKSTLTETILTDQRLLRQIIANLISNAIKYSPPDTEIHIMLDEQDSHYALRVKDHGIGIPEADLKHLFDAFHRGSNVKKVAGTGLGLAVIQQAVELLGGSINVESQVGVGTTITVVLPRVLIP